MSDTHEVISAFLDDAPFDARELADALADPAGRALLIDLIALRHLAQPDAMAAAVPVRTAWRSPLRAVIAAAALLLALAGGYVMGERRSAVDAGGADLRSAPAPTRVVQGATAWQEVPAGEMR